MPFSVPPPMISGPRYKVVVRPYHFVKKNKNKMHIYIVLSYALQPYLAFGVPKQAKPHSRIGEAVPSMDGPPLQRILICTAGSTHHGLYLMAGKNVGTVWSKLYRAVQTVISILGFKKVL